MVDQDRYGRTPLHYAALDNDLRAARSLLDDGADASASDRAGMTPLHFAAQQGSTEVARLLLEREANVQAVDHYGNAPLWTAVFNARGKDELVNLLLEYGSDPLHPNSAGRSPADLARTISGDAPPDWLVALDPGE